MNTKHGERENVNANRDEDDDDIEPQKPPQQRDPLSQVHLEPIDDNTG